MNSFRFVGKIRPFKEKGVTVSEGDGWVNKRVKFSVVCGNDSQVVEASAFRWNDDDENTVYTFSKPSQGEKAQPIQIKWSDRFNEDVVKSVAGFKTFTIDPDGRAYRDQCKTEGNQAELDASNQRYKRFIASWDFVEELEQFIARPDIANRLFEFIGNVEYTYTPKDDGGAYYRAFVLQRIHGVPTTTEEVCEGTLTLYYTKDALSEADENNVATFDGYTTFYNRQDKKSYFAPANTIVDLNVPKIAAIGKLVDKLKPNEVGRSTFTIAFKNGAEKVDITEDDLTDEQKELIDMGLATMEDLVKELGGKVYGDRKTENRIVALYGLKEPIVLTDYKKSDLTVCPGQAPAKKDSDDLLDDDDDII